MIEKLGHKKRLQTMRREWINERKPHRARDTEQEMDVQTSAVDPITKDIDMGATALPTTTTRAATPIREGNEDDDLYTATPKEVLDERRRKRDAAARESLFISDDEGDAGDPPSEDELDALLAEDSLKDLGPSALNAQQPKLDTKRQRQEDDFDDEMEAMAGMDDMW